MTTQPPEPAGEDAPRGPQSPRDPHEPTSPQSPAPAPQSPAPGPQSPAPGPQSPAPGTAPPQQPPAPPGGESPPAAPPSSPGQARSAPGYAGPVPPGGWQQPIPRAAGVPAGVELASWWSRVGAAILDALILTLLGALLVAPGVVLLATDDPVLGGILLGVGIIAYIVAVCVYAPAFMQREGRHNGQSLGKQAVGIRVIRVDRQPYGFGAAFVREFVVKNLLFAFVGGFFLSIPTLLDVLWPLWDDENRALHDMVVNSRVVRA